MKISRSTLVMALLTLVATVIGLALRIHFAAEPLWIDELHTAWVIDSDFGNTAFRAGQGNQTPIYFWISWLSCEPFGYSEFYLRLPSVVFSSSTIVLAALFVWRFTRDPVVSGLTGMLVAIDSWFNFYGSEARPYALLQLLSVLQVGCLAGAMDKVDSSSRMWIAKKVSWSLILLTSAMIATHLTALFLVAVQLLFLLAFRKPSYRNRIFLSLALSCLVVVPLFPTLVSAYEKRADWEPIADSNKLLLEAAPSLIVYILVPAICLSGSQMMEGRFCRTGPIDTQSSCEAPKSQTHEFATAPACSACQRPVASPIVALTLCWGLGPLIIVWMLDFCGTIPIAAIRYAAVGSVAFPIFAGLAIAAIHREKLRLSICLLTILLAAGINPIADSALNSKSGITFRNEDWKSAIRHLAKAPEFSNQPVFLFANLVEDHRCIDLPRDSPLSDYLKFPLTGIYKLPDQADVITMPTQALTRWNANHLRLIQRFDGARIIARVTSPDMQSIVDELQAIASENSVKFDIEIYFQPGNSVETAFISCKN